MANFVADSFTGTPGTDLTAHPPDSGGAWIVAPSPANGTVVLSDANRARCAVMGGAGTVCYLNTPAPSADYDVSADVTVLSNAPITTSVATRVQANGSCYYFTYNRTYSRWYLYRGIPSIYSFNDLGFSAASAPTGTHTWTIQVRGTGDVVTVTGLVDGVAVVTGQDGLSGRLLSAGYAGLYFVGTSANGAGDHVDNFSASAGAPALALSAAATGATSSTVSLAATATGGVGPYTYEWYRSQVFGFVPGLGNLLAGATGATLTDTGLAAGTTWYYVCKAMDSAGSPALTYSSQVQGTTLPVLAYNLWFAGNSLMAGSHATAGNDPGSVALRQLGAAFANVPAPGVQTPANVAIGGQSITLLAEPNPAGYTRLIDTAAALDAHLSSTLANVLVVWELTNELGCPPATITGTQAVANLKAYCQARRAAGWSKILVGTVLPRSYQPGIRPTFESARQEANALLRATWWQFADGLFDPAADTRIGAPGAELSGVYYFQGGGGDAAVHMLDPGYVVVADQMAGAVARVLLAAPATAGAVYPTVSQVLTGIQYGPTGANYTGALVVTTGGLTSEQAAALALLPGIKAKTDTLGTANVTVTSPIAVTTGELSLNVGDDYLAADGRAITLHVTGGPSLTGAAVTLLIWGQSAPGVLGAGGNLSFNLPRTFTAALAKYMRSATSTSAPYFVRAALANSDVVTLVQGTAKLSAASTAPST